MNVRLREAETASAQASECSVRTPKTGEPAWQKFASVVFTGPLRSRLSGRLANPTYRISYNLEVDVYADTELAELRSLADRLPRSGRRTILVAPIARIEL
jgi:hypothetical protein